MQVELPAFVAKRSKDFPAFLIVNCPREDCPGTRDGRPFLVAERSWYRPHRLTADKTGKEFRIIGRACPYCFRASRLPARRSLG